LDENLLELNSFQSMRNFFTKQFPCKDRSHSILKIYWIKTKNIWDLNYFPEKNFVGIFEGSAGVFLKSHLTMSGNLKKDGEALSFSIEICFLSRRWDDLNKSGLFCNPLSFWVMKNFSSPLSEILKKFLLGGKKFRKIFKLLALKEVSVQKIFFEILISRFLDKFFPQFIISIWFFFCSWGHTHFIWKP